ncbi:MAG: lactonase family protein [Lachnospiraceae bacterium]|nr:lactonase family protein [Lachnospiraceae bacterium]
MAESKYIAYVGTYTHGSSKGIHIFDLDVEQGRMTERKVVPINNPSYVTIANNGKFLYSIADEGVEVFQIEENGDLIPVDTASIQGMRGCYLETDSKDQLLFIGGYHDGKITVMRLNEDGTFGPILDGIFHKGLGSVAERNFRPHISCATLTPDEKYLCVVDSGVDHVNIYRIDPHNGKLSLIDMLHCELEAAPRHMLFSDDGRFAYLICERKNYVMVYSYDGSDKNPQFEMIQMTSTLDDIHATGCAAAAMKFSPTRDYLMCSNAGDNSVCAFKVNKETGMLKREFVLPVSGEYPKDIDMFPDSRHLFSLNHESNTITFFRVNYEKKTMVMNGKGIPIETPNCVVVKKL